MKYIQTEKGIPNKSRFSTLPLIRCSNVSSAIKMNILLKYTPLFLYKALFCSIRVHTYLCLFIVIIYLFSFCSNGVSKFVSLLMCVRVCVCM